MRPDDRDSNQGATIIPLARPGTGPAGQVSDRPPRLLDRVRAGLRARHYSRRTEKAYVGWIRRFILFHSKRHPDDMSSVEVGAYLSNLASEAKSALPHRTKRWPHCFFSINKCSDASWNGWATWFTPNGPSRFPWCSADRRRVTCSRACKARCGWCARSSMALACACWKPCTCG
jgi:hypothetical protein